jgi:hypothetical protein
MGPEQPAQVRLEAASQVVHSSAIGAYGREATPLSQKALLMGASGGSIVATPTAATVVVGSGADDGSPKSRASRRLLPNLADSHSPIITIKHQPAGKQPPSQQQTPTPPLAQPRASLSDLTNSNKVLGFQTMDVSADENDEENQGGADAQPRLSWLRSRLIGRPVNIL